MLKYSKDAIINFSGDPQQKVDDIFAMANKCRWWVKPIFANESQYLPNQNRESQVPLFPNPEQQPTALATLEQSASAPKTPEKLEENVFVQALLVGAGFFVLYKLLS